MIQGCNPVFDKEFPLINKNLLRYQNEILGFPDMMSGHPWTRWEVDILERFPRFVEGDGDGDCEIRGNLDELTYRVSPSRRTCR